jgi:hypothetical protein
VESCFSLIQDSVGVIQVGCGFVFWVAELVGEAFFRHLESSPLVFDVDSLVGMQLAYIRGCGEIRESIFRVLRIVVVRLDLCLGPYF